VPNAMCVARAVGVKQPNNPRANASKRNAEAALMLHESERERMSTAIKKGEARTKG